MAGTSAAQSEAVDTRRGPTGDSGSDSSAPTRARLWPKLTQGQTTGDAVRSAGTRAGAGTEARCNGAARDAQSCVNVRTHCTEAGSLR